MNRIAWGLLLTLAGLACLDIPPEQAPVDSPRKATATVDSDGRRIEGGNLVLEIPAGAIPDGERILVTIDEILGAPEGHVSDTYLVSPEGYSFLEPVQVTYRYSERMVRDVVDLSRLFVGVARGPRWEMLDGAATDTQAMEASGRVLHFSVFGLIDPLTPMDGGFYDARPSDDAATGQDRAAVDAASDAASPPDTAIAVDAAGVQGLHFQLTWAGGPTSDLDLHLYLSGGQSFSTTQDCYYANCKNASAPVDWPPTGAANNPYMDLDDTNGYGPENINMGQPESGTYVVAVHVYSMHSDPLPLGFEVKIFQGSTLRGTFTRQITACDQFFNIADVSVGGGGSTLNVTERVEVPTLAGHGSC